MKTFSFIVTIDLEELSDDDLEDFSVTREEADKSLTSDNVKNYLADCLNEGFQQVEECEFLASEISKVTWNDV